MSAGGYSRHAGNIAQLRGGIQVGRTFNADELQGFRNGALRGKYRMRQGEKTMGLAGRAVGAKFLGSIKKPD